MSDPKRATLITVGATKSAKNNVNKTVRLTINLDESNESKYPELNYKELVIAEERKKRERVENGKTAGLDPFSDNNDDVERIARKFEQKYGGKSTYGRKGRSKHDDFADIGAGYDENDSFIDNTHGYDEMIPPECDTLYGGFYINCGSLEFKNVPENMLAMSDTDAGGNRRNKRRISSSSSEEESSESSSESESQDEKDPKAIANGDVDSHKTEHRKKKNKKIDKKKAKKVRRTDSSAATSGKQTSDDNAHGDGESADSRTSQSDSLTSKPAPSSENAVTSDSSRDVEAKVEVKLPAQVVQVLEALEASVAKHLADTPNMSAKELIAKNDEFITRVSSTLSSCACSARVSRAAWARGAVCLRTSRAKLLHAVRAKQEQRHHNSTPATHTSHSQPTPSIAQPATASSSTSTTTTTTTASTNKRKCEDDLDDFDPDQLSLAEREAIIVETLQRLKALIDERKPAMIANYNAECERVQEERKKIQIATAEGGPAIEKRLPKRRFPWCARSRALVCRVARAAGGRDNAARVLHARALPLFPPGFVRMPTLLRQADLSKEIKASDLKRQRLGSASQPPPNSQPMQFTEPIQFPSSLTVTTTTAHKQSPDKIDTTVSTDTTIDKYKTNFGSILNSFTLSKDLIVEKPEKKDTHEKKEELYIPPNNIGSITITPVPANPPKPEKKLNNNVQMTNAVQSDKHSGFIRVKSPAALNEMVKKEKIKKPEKPKDKTRVESPLHIDTSYQPSKKDPSPKHKEEIPQKQIESMRVAENNIPRPALVPVHHSPTFAKPDKRPPEVKKKKDVVIVSDVDPLSDQQEPLAVDDSSSDVELVEDNRTDKNEPKRDKSETVPSKDRVNVNVDKKVINKCRKEKETRKSESEEAISDIDTIMRNIREMEHSQEPTKFNSNSFGGVISNAKYEKSSSQSSLRTVFDPRDKDKLTNFFEQNGWM
ncbi:yemanuclein isoform X3 [Anticarsia gemmatalis]|uniref:yemanuclein isoform X3 n=1 Tax=Anticarsia gemmatalis TaxID=129554 RepID=UPI003F76E814